VVGFAILLGLAAAGLRGVETLGAWSVDRWIVSIAGIGVAIGAGLTLVEVFLIEAVCLVCTLGFGLGILVFVLAFSLTR
jgi:uncharacterized membrane protein